MLGFGGHFLTKARRYSVTFALLRAARVDYRRATDDTDAAVIRAADHTDEETTLIIGTLTFAGAGWHNTGDALLANTSAAKNAPMTAASAWPPAGTTFDGVDVLDSEMAYAVGGPATAPATLLFTHGNPTSSFLWRHVIADLVSTSVAM
jgi:hypothetical protein